MNLIEMLIQRIKNNELLKITNKDGNCLSNA